MRALIAFLGLFLLAAFGSSAPHFAATQDHTYTSPKVDYVVEFPSPAWKLVDEPETKQRLQHRPGQANDEAERCQVADQNVLEHVHEQELGGERVDRRHQRQQHEREAEPEHEPPPAGHRRSPAP